MTVTSEDLCWGLRKVKFITESFYNMRCLVKFITAVCLIFLLKLKWRNAILSRPKQMHHSRLRWGSHYLMEGCSRKWDNHCTFPRLNAWLFTGICKLCRNDHLAAVCVVNPGEDSFTVQCDVTSSRTMQFRRSSSMHSGARQEICIILTQMMILFIGELNQSGQRFGPEKISE